MKKVILPLLIISCSDLYAQNISKIEKVSDHSIHIVGEKFEGVIMNENYFQNPDDTTEAKITRFTPSIQDILIAEKVLDSQIKNQKQVDAEYICKHLSQYRRQYLGYLDKNGEKILYVNCFPNDEDWANKKIKRKVDGFLIPTWYDRLFKVFDGGKSFWQTTINLNLKKIISFAINGVA